MGLLRWLRDSTGDTGGVAAAGLEQINALYNGTHPDRLDDREALRRVRTVAFPSATGPVDLDSGTIVIHTKPAELQPED